MVIIYHINNKGSKMNFKPSDIVITAENTDFSKILNISSKYLDDVIVSSEDLLEIIENILIKLPLPIFYMDVSNPEDIIPINNKKIILSIQMFMNNKLRIKDFKFFSNLENKTYNEIDTYLKRILNETRINTFQIEARTPELLREIVENRLKGMIN